MNKIIIPFGEECYTAQSIDSKFSKNNLRSCAFPFDYVGHTYVENIYDNMVDVLTTPYVCKSNDFILQLFDDKYFLCHKKYGFKYWHDIYTTDDKINIDDDIIKFIEKYNRRYDRLKYCLTTDVICLSVNHFNNIYTKKYKQESIYKLFNLLKSYCIKFIAVNYGEDLYNINNLQFVNLPINFDLPFVESKKLFIEQLNHFVKSQF